MPFYTNTSGYIDTGGARPSTSQGACSCGDHRGRNPSEGGAMVQAMRALVIASKVDQALKRAAPLHAQAKGDKPMIPRGVLSGKPSATTEQASKRAYRTRWGEIAKAQGKPSTSAPLRPRGILEKGA